MARAATTDEKIIMQYPGQSSALRLAIFTPHVIYTARLASVPSSTDKVAQISFVDGVGTLANVKKDMMLYIGATAGAYDIGIVRIRKSPISGTFYIGEESIVEWQADAYLTIVDDYDLWARHIRIDGTTPKIDYDISYSDQHTSFVPVPVLGPIVRVAKLQNGTANIQLGPETGYSSWVFGSSISSRAWTMEGATLNDATLARPVATITAAGWYLTYCTVTAANGKTRTGVRYVYAYDDDNPPAPFIFNSCDESVDGGGTTFSVTMTRAADFDSVRKHALCVLFSEDVYDSTSAGYIGSLGPIAGAENIEAIGRITEESIRYDAEKGEVTFEIAGLQEFMKRTNSFPTGLELAVKTPSAWTSMPALTPDRALWHLLEYRCTATTIMDVILTGDSRYAKELQSLASNLWAQMDEFAGETILANLGVDQYGRFFAEIDPQLTPESSRDFPEIMELEKRDYTGGVELEHITTPEISLVDLSGVSINSSGHASAFFALAPGHVQNRFGEIRVDDRLLLSNQAQANQLAGLIYGVMTNPYKPVSINIRNNKFISCFPAQYVTFTIAAADNPRGIDETLRLIPRRRRLEYNKQTGYKSYSLEFEAETFEGISVNGDIPGSEDTSIPPIPSLPEMPIIPITFPTDVSGLPEGSSVVMILDDTKGILFTKNFSAPVDEILWQFWNAGIDPADIPNISDFHITPSGAVWVVALPSVGWSPTDGGGIYRAASIGGMFVKVLDYEWIREQSPDAQFDTDNGGKRFLGGFGVNTEKPDEVAIVAGGNNFPNFTADVHFFLWDGTQFVEKVSHFGCNAYYGQIKYANGKWLLTYELNGFIPIWDSALCRMDATLMTFEFYDHIFQSGTAMLNLLLVAPSGIVYAYHYPSGQFAISNDLGENFTLTGDDLEGGELAGSYACDPSGALIMGVWDTGKGKSSDFGSTWSGLPSLPPGGAYSFAYSGGEGGASRWIAARGVIRFSDDFGNTWINKEGNIGYLIPVDMSIIQIVVPGYPG